MYALLKNDFNICGPCPEKTDFVACEQQSHKPASAARYALLFTYIQQKTDITQFDLINAQVMLLLNLLLFFTMYELLNSSQYNDETSFLHKYLCT